MWARAVEVSDPGRDLGAGVIEVEEQRLIEKLVTHAAVDGVDGSCTPGFMKRPISVSTTPAAGQGARGTSQS